MNWPWVRSLVFPIALWIGGAGVSRAALPFEIDTQDGQWKPALVNRTVAPGITFEMVVSHVSGKERLIILSSPEADSLSAFARRLKDSFTGYRSTANPVETAADKIGYHGRTLTFDMVNEKSAYDCELFVFAADQKWWGVLHSRQKGAPVASRSAFDLLKQDGPRPAEVVGLDPIRVKESPLSAFPISFDVVRSRDSNRVLEIIVTDVRSPSQAERDGIKVGDRIVSVNGRKTTDFAVGVGKNSELGQIFLNRHPGDQVDLELLSAGSTKPFAVALKVPSFSLTLGL